MSKRQALAQASHPVSKRPRLVTLEPPPSLNSDDEVMDTEDEEFLEPPQDADLEEEEQQITPTLSDEMRALQIFREQLPFPDFDSTPGDDPSSSASGDGSNGNQQDQSSSPHEDASTLQPQQAQSSLLNNTHTMQIDKTQLQNLDLPYEIREMIWKELVGHRVLHIDYRTKNYKQYLSHTICGNPEKCRDAYLSRKPGYCAYPAHPSLARTTPFYSRPSNLKEPTQKLELYQMSPHSPTRQWNTARLPRNLISLLHVNKSVCDEVLRALYSSSTFSFGTGLSFRRFLDRVNTVQLAMIRVIDLKCNIRVIWFAICGEIASFSTTCCRWMDGSQHSGQTTSNIYRSCSCSASAPMGCGLR